MVKIISKIRQNKFLKILILITGISGILGINFYLSIKDIGQAPLCYKDSCINLDPREKKCDTDVQTLIEEEFKETTIQLRYSAKCDAAWSRAVVPVGSILYVEDVQGKKYGYYDLDGKLVLVPNDGIPGPHYGNMGPGRKLKACAQLPLPDNKRLCTKLAKVQ